LIFNRDSRPVNNRCVLMIIAMPRREVAGGPCC
jgi:hypothetical protein